MDIVIGGNTYSVDSNDDGSDLQTQVQAKLDQMNQDRITAGLKNRDAYEDLIQYVGKIGQDSSKYTPEQMARVAVLQTAYAATTAAFNAVDSNYNAAQSAWMEQVAKVKASLAEGNTMMQKALSAAAEATHDFAGMDPMQVIAMVFAACKQLVADKIAKIGADMEARNADTKALTSLMADVRNRRPANNDRIGDGDDKGKYPGYIPDNVIAELRARGVQIPGADTDVNGQYRLSQVDFDKVLTNIQGVIDNNGTQQQLVLNDLQKYNNQFQECSDLVTNVVKASKDVASSIIANMRG